jgi:hypothetical protein
MAQLSERGAFAVAFLLLLGEFEKIRTKGLT